MIATMVSMYKLLKKEVFTRIFTVVAYVQINSRTQVFQGSTFIFSTSMEEVPVDYLQRLAGNYLEEDLRYTIARYINF